MVTTQRSRRGGLFWAILGGLVLIAGIVAIIVIPLAGQPSPTATPTPATTLNFRKPHAVRFPRRWRASSSTRASRRRAGCRNRSPPIPRHTSAPRWRRHQPSTPRKSSRDEWLTYLDTWFTPDTRYASEADQQAAMEASQVELRQGVVLPQEEWDSLAAEDGRVVAVVTGDVAFVPVTEDPSGDMSIGTGDVTLTFTRSDGGDGETSYDETVRVSVQVLCGEGSVPTPNTAQQAGDCKVVRYFTEPLEP